MRFFDLFIVLGRVCVGHECFVRVCALLLLECVLFKNVFSYKMCSLFLSVLVMIFV